ncbi:MAG: cytochrome c peroxidase, partial [Myxococcota bacterium]
MNRHLLAALASSFLVFACDGSEPAGPVPSSSLEELGEELFFDTALSVNRTQSCATCHDPERGYVDSRVDERGERLPVSQGDDGVSFGSRNAPSAAYAAFVPSYTVGSRQRFNKQTQNRLYSGPLGGLFYDGRSSSLEEQSGGPPLSPVEMGFSNAAEVVARLASNPRYLASFEALFGEDVMGDSAQAYAAMQDAIAAYERTEVFAPFDSKYDRSLRGDASLSFKELTGRALFFSEFANCAICHQLRNNGDPVGRLTETFSGYEYHNIGVPSNPQARSLSGVAQPDQGLLERDDVDDPSFLGLFRTPTLRNVAVTGPYMHNGVFKDLRTVIEFSDR